MECTCRGQQLCEKFIGGRYLITVKFRVLFLLACFVESVWLLVAQLTGSSILLLSCLLAFFALACFAAIKGVGIPVFLFFLPFSPLMKLEPGSTSLYTIALLAVYIIYLVTNGRIVFVENIKCIFAGSVLFLLVLIVKTVTGGEITSDFIWFFASVLLIPFLIKELNGKYDFYWLTVFFVIGIAFAAITARYLMVFPTIRQYVNVHDTLGTLRYSGYYGDPNFYAAQITAAIGGVLVLILNTVRKMRLIVLALFAAVLVYCGFLSVSKSFFLVLLCLVLLWLIDLLVKRGKLSVKFMVILVIGIGAIFLLSSTVFTDNIDLLLERFGRDNNWSDFTTGRIELWNRYFDVFEADPPLLFFGKGLTDTLVGGRGSHNTLIQSVYQLGFVGSVLLTVWMINYFRLLLAKTRCRMGSLVQVCVLLIGAFGPWMALDLLFFYEFFLIPIYVCAGIRFLNTEG